jgi:hypothetical protein
MTDNNGKPPAPSELPFAGFPGQHFPTVYADGVTSINPTSEIVKMYFSRLDPNFDVTKGTAVQPHLQMVMSTTGFVQMSIFFSRIVANMLKTGVLTEEKYSESKKLAGGPE